MRKERLQSFRVKRGYTQETLAAELKTDKRQITRWENGESTPGGDKLMDIAQVLNVSVDYLLGLSDNPTLNTRIDNLTEDEYEVVAAMRKGKKLEAINIISGS